MDKIIVTSLLVIAGIISVVFVFNTVYPAVVEGSQSLIAMERRIDDRIKSQIEIVHAVAEGQLATQTVYVWVKNIGSTTIKALDRCDLFFGPEGDFSRIPYDTGTSYWTAEVENDSGWKPTATLKITIHYHPFVQNGERCWIKVVAPNGVSDDCYFTHVE